MLYKEYEKLIKEIDSCENPTELEDILSKIESLDFTLKFGVKEPDGWRSSVAIMNRYKKLLKYPLEVRIQNHPNYKKMQLISELIAEGNYLRGCPPTNIANYLRKVEKSFGKEIGFPNSIINSFKVDEVKKMNGIYSCSITEEDLEAVLIRLESYLEELSIIKKEKAENKTQPQPINIYATAQANNQISINVDIQISSALKEIEDDDNLTEDEIAECKEILSELKKIQKEKPKKKWEKCKSILKWLGDKTVKFAEWFIPIISNILINKE